MTKGGARGRGHRGVTLLEVVTVLVLVIMAGLIFVTMIPRQRENSRAMICRANLMRIGVATGKYVQADGLLPEVKLGGGESPLSRLFPQFGQGKDAGRIPEFICPSDPRALGEGLPAPVSYRATTGDSVAGAGGAFAPGRAISFDEVESADGASYTAGFAERLVGDGQEGSIGPWNYSEVAGPVPEGGCPDEASGNWRGDAGGDWRVSGWRDTLYNHAALPNAERSCIATDGATARMGASSGHVREIHVLMLDGSVRAVAPTIDGKIWRQLARIADRPRGAGEPPAASP